MATTVAEPVLVDTNVLIYSTTTLSPFQVHDANTVATMLAHGIPKLLTHNVADFSRFAASITVIPLIP